MPSHSSLRRHTASSSRKTVLGCRWVPVVSTATTRAFSKQLFSTYSITVIARKTISRFYLWMRHVRFQMAQLCLVLTVMNEHNAKFRAIPLYKWKKKYNQLCPGVYMVWLLFLSSFCASCGAINSRECCFLSYFMCHWLQQSLLESFHRGRMRNLFLPPSALHFLTLADCASTYMFTMNLTVGVTKSFFTCLRCAHQYSSIDTCNCRSACFAMESHDKVQKLAQT